MAKAKKLPSGNWRVNLFVGNENGKRVYKSFTAHTPEEAEFLAAQYKLDKNRKKNPVKLTVGEAIDKYIKDNETILSPSTIKGYKIIRRNHLQSLIDIQLDDLTQKIINDAVKVDAKRLSPKTVANAHGLLSTILHEYNPGFQLNTKLPKKKKYISKMPDLPRLLDILKAVQGTEIEIPVLLAVWLGMRMSEIRGLKWENVHDDYIIIKNVIVDTDNAPVEKDITKSYTSTRKVWISKRLSDKLKTAPRAGEYVTALSGQAIYKRFTRLLEKHGIEHCRFHDLRRVNASIMLMLDIPDKYAMERGGWSTNSILKNVYQETFTSEKEVVNNKIDGYFEKMLDKIDKMQHKKQHDENISV
jgi:integrase